MASPVFNYKYLNVPSETLLTDIGLSDGKIIVSGIYDSYLYNNNNVSTIRVSFQIKPVAGADSMESNFLEDSTTSWFGKTNEYVATGSIASGFYKSVDFATYTATTATIVVGTATEIFGAVEKIVNGVDAFFVIPNGFAKQIILRSYYLSSTLVKNSITISSASLFGQNCLDVIYADPNFIYIVSDMSGTLSKITTAGTVSILTTGIFAMCQLSATSTVAYFAGDNGKLLSIVKSTSVFTDYSYSATNAINSIAVSDLGKLVMVGENGTVVVKSGTDVQSYGSTGSKSLMSVEYISGTFFVAGDSIVFDFASTAISDDWDISFEGIDFLDSGIKVQTWEDSHKKDIKTEPNKVTHGGFSKRFSYFGLNQITLTGYITTASVVDLRNKTSYGYGRLYKRKGIYTNAELKEFNVDPGTTGRVRKFSAKFYAERPYYYRELNIGGEYNLNFSDTVTPEAFYTNLTIDIDDVEISYLASITSTVNYFITTGYDVLCTKNDTTPTTSVLTSTDWASVTYLDNNKNSIGICTAFSTTIKRFYVRGSTLTTTYPHHIFDDFDIYYKDSAGAWKLYNNPFTVKIKNITTLGNVLIFDNLNINTKEFKINFNSTATRNLINFADNRSKILSIIFPDKFSMLKSNNFTSELRIDTKTGVVFKDGVRYSAVGQLLRLYSDLTNLWVFGVGTKTVKFLTNYKQTYFPV